MVNRMSQQNRLNFVNNWEVFTLSWYPVVPYVLELLHLFYQSVSYGIMHLAISQLSQRYT